ncbi:MAG: methylmalonyl-CoA mutase, partial [Actinobacteria bacterium]|nr:methylmalonyl-CoA mutase [Actinomycetota bacterium]
AFAQQQVVESGERVIVGVNGYTDAVDAPLEILRISHEVEKGQVAALHARRSARDAAAVSSALKALEAAVATDVNVIPALLDACRVEATLGEVCDIMRSQFGTYREPARL